MEVLVEVQPLPTGKVALYTDPHQGAVVMTPAYARQLAAQIQQAADAAEDAGIAARNPQAPGPLRPTPGPLGLAHRAASAWDVAEAEGAFLYCAIVSAERDAQPCTRDTLAAEFPMLSPAVLQETLADLQEAGLITGVESAEDAF